MRSSFIRIVSLAMLVIVLGIFSGGMVLASTAGSPAAVDSCCGGADEDNLPSGEDSSPCSSPDCHCLTCLELAVAAVIDLGHCRTEITSLLPGIASLHTTSFIVSIDQPPEQS